MIRELSSEEVKQLRLVIDSKTRAALKLKPSTRDPRNNRTKARQEASKKTGRIPQHGTVNEYSNYGCRCDDCKKAQSDDLKRRYFKPCIDGCGRLAWHQPGKSGRCRWCTAKRARKSPHGTETRYRHCKCNKCREAATKARIKRLQKAH